MKLWEGLSQDLNYNVMFSQRGVMNLAHTLQDVRDTQRRVNANRLKRHRRRVPHARPGPGNRTRHQPGQPLPGAGRVDPAARGRARHDAVAWGYARGADRAGVIIQNCQVTGIRREGGAVVGVETTQGYIKAAKVAVVAAGNTTTLADMAGVRLPLESHPLQALVSEPLKPVLNSVIMSNAVHAYISQSDKGDLVIGAGIDQYTGFRAARRLPDHRGHAGRDRGNVPRLLARAHEPPVGRHRRRVARRLPHHQQDPGPGAVLQLWLGHGRLQGHAGIGLGVRPHHRARRAHPLNAPFSLDRFYTGHLIDEHGAAAVAH